MEIIALLSEPSAWAALLTLIALELVLGIDNLVFIAIVSSKLPAAQQSRARAGSGGVWRLACGSACSR